MTDNIKCPCCGGSGVMIGFTNGGQDLSTHRFGGTTCFRCSGAGEVPAAMSEWIARGKELRKRRFAAGYTLLTGAKALGMTTAQLSAIETGRREAPKEADRWWQTA